ncbi:hypothetical protein [uncultured Enterococcus sp.]|uniref:hypothetical protein n=1 Tax=uncultured Enterococcus sp. TaxID=167972 RepID=UPI002599A54C|nr:hypothetical protein [uncultured Enterococcus sp.]
MADFTILEGNTKTITLSDGSVIALPRLTNKRVISIAKLLITDLSGLYATVKETVRKPVYYQEGSPIVDSDGKQVTDELGNVKIHGASDPVFDKNGKPVTVFDSNDIQRIVIVALDELDEATITKLLSILTGIPETQVLDIDFTDTITIVAEFLANTNIKKAFLAVNKLTDTLKGTTGNNSQQSGSSLSNQSTITPLT